MALNSIFILDKFSENTTDFHCRSPLFAGIMPVMNISNQPQTFFLPEAISEQHSMVHASCYRLSLSMLRRAEHEPVPVLIDNLQYTALITDSNIYFADNSDMQIKISWHLHLAEARDVNEQHIPMKVMYYEHGLEQLQQKLTGEYYKALMLMDEKYRTELIPSGNTRIQSL